MKQTTTSMVASLLILFGTSSIAASDGPALAKDWLDRTGQFYSDHPELQIPQGSGWKHYVKARKFFDDRTVDGRFPTAGDRVDAWEIARLRRGNASSESGWFNLGPPNISGRIVDLKFHPTDPTRVYAASASGGVWISSDHGDTWRTTTDEIPSIAIGAVCVLPTNPDVVLAATGEGLAWSYVVFGVGIYKSTDAGETWNPTSFTHEITDNHGFHAMEANPLTGTLLAGANDGLWRSTDEGDTWDRVRSDGEYFDVKWRPGSANRVYATKARGAQTNGVYVSTNDGLNWLRVGSGQPPSSRISKTRLAVTEADPSVVYAHFGDSQTNGTYGIYRTTDDGATWTARNSTTNISGTQGGYAVTIAVDPTNIDRVVAGGIKLYLSTNGGVQFAETGTGNPLGDETDVHYDHHATAWEPGSTTNLWVGTDGGCWRSTDAGSNWSPRRNGLITTQYYDVCLDPSDPDFVMGGSQDNGLTWAEDPDAPWFPSTLIADGFACHVEPLDSNTIYSEAQFGYHVKSTDRGQSWFETSNGLFGTPEPFAPLDLDPNLPGHLYTATGSGIFRTLNGQSLWEQVAAHSATWVSISPVDGDIVWTVDADAASNPVRVSTNDGATWVIAASYGFPVGNEMRVLAHPTDPATAFITFAGYSGVAHIARTTNFGVSWEDRSGDFPPDPANTMIVDPLYPEHWYVGSDTGVWWSRDEGATWLPVGAEFPSVLVYDLEIQATSRKLVAITYGRGAWETGLLAPSDVDVLDARLRHPELLLDPPSPNPVRDRTVLRFASRRDGRATLEVHDSTGRLVARVAELDHSDGIVRKVQWNPGDVPAGKYFVTLRSGSESVSRELLILR